MLTTGFLRSLTIVENIHTKLNGAFPWEEIKRFFGGKYEKLSTLAPFLQHNLRYQRVYEVCIQRGGILKNVT